MGGKLCLFKKKSTTSGSSSAVDGKGTSNGHAYGLGTSPKPPRHHPYDEVDENELAANRLAASNENMRDVPPRDYPEKQSTLYSDAASACPQALYVNCDPTSNQKTNNIKQPNDSTLNYIEVEVLPSSGSEVKKPASRSPCTYTNIIHDNGQIVLAE